MMMRLLRGLAGRLLACGCFVGVYETYDGQIVSTIDACGPGCRQPGHALHAVVPDLPNGGARQQENREPAGTRL